MITKIVSGTLAALTIGGVALAGPASAQPRGEWRGDRHDGNEAAVIGAGVLGLALGAGLASQHSYYAPRPAYYAPRPVYYAPHYARACPTYWRWDRYLGRYVRAASCY